MASFPLASSKPTTTVTSAAYSLTVADANIRADATIQNIVINLPLASSIKGYIFEVKKVNSNANTVSLACTGTDTLDGVSTKVIVSYNDTLRFQSNGATWDVLSSTAPTSDASARHSTRPNMLFDFSNSGVVDPRLTVSRNSTASYISKSGQIKYAPVNTARIGYNAGTGLAKGLMSEEQSTNLLTYSEMFDSSAWVKSNAIVAGNYSSSPDGSFTASKLMEDSTATGTHQIMQSRTGSNETVTFSVFAKADLKTSILLQMGNGTDFASVSFNLVTGVAQVRSTDTADYINTYGRIEQLSNGYWRCSLTTTKGTLNTNNHAYINLLGSSNETSYAGVPGAGVYIWGAQLEARSFPTSYIPTTQTFSARTSVGTYVNSLGYVSSAASGAVRMNSNALDLSSPAKLLVENASTNLLTYSDQFDNAIWVKTNATVTANSVASPDGTTSADKVVESSTAAEHSIQQSFTPSGAGVRVTFSCFMRSAEKTSARIGFSGGGLATDCAVIVNLTSGNVTAIAGAPESYSVQPFGNGWYRISCTKTLVSTASCAAKVFISDAVSYAGDGTSGIYVWGAQLEAGLVSSYIPTTTAAVTRVADTYTSVSATRLADSVSYSLVGLQSFNKFEGTVYCESQQYVEGLPLKQLVAVELGDGTNSNTIQIGTQYNTTNFQMSIQDTSGNSTLNMVKAGTTASTKRVVAYSSGNHAGVFDGNVPVKNASTSLPEVTTLSIGCRTTGSGQLNGFISKLAYYAKRLSDAELSALTTA